MKGKLFVLLVMVGIPTMTWAFLAWAVMLLLGALHGVCDAIPNLSFLESFLATLMAFAIIVFAISMATDNTTPARRHDGR